MYSKLENWPFLDPVFELSVPNMEVNTETIGGKKNTPKQKLCENKWQMTELFILLTIGVEKYQEKMRENVEKENSRRFPLNFELSVASRQLLLSGREGKKSREINKNKFKSKISIFWSKDRYHQSNKRKLGKNKTSEESWQCPVPQ